MKRLTVALFGALLVPGASAQQPPAPQPVPAAQPAPSPQEKPVLRQRTGAESGNAASEPGKQPVTYRAMTPLLRVQRMRMPDAYNDTMEDTCIQVRDDGSYHLEKRKQRPDQPRAEVKVYDDAVPPETLEQLRQLLEKSELRALQGDDFGPGESMFIQNSAPEMLMIGITREGEPTQNLHIRQKATYDASKKTLKPLLEWAKQVEKRKLEPVKDAKPTHCPIIITNP
jgi:hypothetical protein